MSVLVERATAWGVALPEYPLTRRLALVGLPLVPVLVLAVIVAGLAGSVLLGLVGGAVVTVLGFAVVWRRSLPATRVPFEPGADRFANLVQGVARDLGLDPSVVLVVDDRRPNAVVGQRGGGRAIAVTQGLIDTFTRTEQEAVAAHCLVRLAASPTLFVSLGAGLSPALDRFAPPVGVPDDAATVAVTRYPPALADAISKAEPLDRWGPASFVAASPAHATAAERMAALNDL